MRVEITYENRNQILDFSALYFPAINEWLKNQKISCKMETIQTYELLDENPYNWFATGFGETVTHGCRYIFDNEEDAIHFKLRWSLEQIDETDEWVQKYLTLLRKGCNQSVTTRQTNNNY